VSEYGARLPLTERESVLRGRVMLVALLGPLVIQFGGCLFR